MKKFSLLLILSIFSFLFLCFYYSKRTKGQEKLNSSNKVIKDTCYYYLSGTGLTNGLTILDITPFDCKQRYDTIGKILNQNLKDKYPDAYFQLENRKINGPYKNLKEAEQSILDLIKRFNIKK